MEYYNIQTSITTFLVGISSLILMYFLNLNPYTRLNVTDGKEYNFDKRTWGEIIALEVPYDLGSDMHYGSKVKTIYNVTSFSKPYCSSDMFVSRGIPSFAELLRKFIYRFKNRIELSTNSIITVCLSPRHATVQYTTI